MPLPLAKILLLLKFGKYPIVAIADTLREYRRKERIRRADGGHETRERHFFHHPVRALRDRRFWIKAVTNSAELLIHLLTFWSWIRNAALRRVSDAYLVWRPHHKHERALFEEVEHEPWRVVFRRTGQWLWSAGCLWHSAGHDPHAAPPHVAPPPAQGSAVAPAADSAVASRASDPAAALVIQPHGRRRRWREVHFDGGVIALRIGPRPWRRPVLTFRRRGASRLLRLNGSTAGRVMAEVIDAAGVAVHTSLIGAGEPALAAQKAAAAERNPPPANISTTASR